MSTSITRWCTVYRSVSPKYTRMARSVKPNPLGPLLMMMAGLRTLMRGDSSLQGLASLLEAVLDPPGLWMD